MIGWFAWHTIILISSHTSCQACPSGKWSGAGAVECSLCGQGGVVNHVNFQFPNIY